jgi:DNA-directed RNA polymerase specialized sigma24 family protein
MNARDAQFERFPTTHWSLVGAAGGDHATARRQSLERLLKRYLPALRAHLVHGKGVPEADADDVLQQFVADKVLRRNLISQADQRRGKFRTFLLTALNRYYFNAIRDSKAKKRSPNGGQVVEAGEQAAMIAVTDTPSREFDVRWARGVIDEAMNQMRRECQRSDQPAAWGLFESRVVRPLMKNEPAASYEELVARFDLKSPAQASNLLVTAKRMFARSLRAVVGEYAREPEEIEEELADLRNILAQGGSCNGDE